MTDVSSVVVEAVDGSNVTWTEVPTRHYYWLTILNFGYLGIRSCEVGSDVGRLRGTVCRRYQSDDYTAEARWRCGLLLECPAQQQTIQQYRYRLQLQEVNRAAHVRM